MKYSGLDLSLIFSIGFFVKTAVLVLWCYIEIFSIGVVVIYCSEIFRIGAVVIYSVLEQ